MISIVIPFYSNISWLNEALESVYNQTFKDYEIIVINDGSNEDDSEFLLNHSKFINYHRTINRGPGYARNLGISLAKRKYVAFLDSDDLWLPDKLEQQFLYMESNKFYWSHTGYILFDNYSNLEIKTIEVNDFYGKVFKKSLISSPIATPCVMISREVLLKDQLLRFSEEMRFGQDGYLWLKLACKYEVGVLPMPLTKVRIRGSNAGSKARVYLQVKSQIWEALNNKIQFPLTSRNIPFLTKVAYKMNYFNFKIILSLEKNFSFNYNFIEFISKILYLPTYIILKIQKFILT